MEKKTRCASSSQSWLMEMTLSLSGGTTAHTFRTFQE
jgi:hypothetical protein